jgi:hypothetical protein
MLLPPDDYQACQDKDIKGDEQLEEGEGAGEIDGEHGPDDSQSQG